MRNFSVVFLKIILSSLSAITISLSTLLIILIFNLWMEEGLPPLENMKFSAALFFVVILLFIICQCIKNYVDMAIDSRDKATR